jgi:hypothetical protein
VQLTHTLIYKRKVASKQIPERDPQTGLSWWRNFLVTYKKYLTASTAFIISAFWFLTIRLILGHIALLQWIVFLFICLLIYSVTFTETYNKFVMFSQSAETKFQEYLKQKHWIWRTGEVTGIIIRILFITYIILYSLGFTEYLQVLGIILSIVLFYYGLLSFGLFFLALKKKSMKCSRASLKMYKKFLRRRKRFCCRGHFFRKIIFWNEPPWLCAEFYICSWPSWYCLWQRNAL